MVRSLRSLYYVPSQLSFALDGDRQWCEAMDRPALQLQDWWLAVAWAAALAGGSHYARKAAQHLTPDGQARLRVRVNPAVALWGRRYFTPQGGGTGTSRCSASSSGPSRGSCGSSPDGRHRHSPRGVGTRPSNERGVQVVLGGE